MAISLGMAIRSELRPRSSLLTEAEAEAGAEAEAEADGRWRCSSAIDRKSVV